jgi:hypothetical protein
VDPAESSHGGKERASSGQCCAVRLLRAAKRLQVMPSPPRMCIDQTKSRRRSIRLKHVLRVRMQEIGGGGSPTRRLSATWRREPAANLKKKYTAVTGSSNVHRSDKDPAGIAPREGDLRRDILKFRHISKRVDLPLATKIRPKHKEVVDFVGRPPRRSVFLNSRYLGT